jgi:hypothetical protein
MVISREGAQRVLFGIVNDDVNDIGDERSRRSLA